MEEAAYRHIFQRYPDAVFILDARFRILEVNPCACDTLGFSREELLSFHFMGLLADAPLDAAFLVSIERDGLREMETALKTREGKLLHVLLKIRTFTDGLNERVLLVGQDISKVRTMEALLRREADVSSSITETANALMMALDPEGKLIFFNRAAEEITGYNRVEAAGKGWLETFVPESERKRVSANVSLEDHSNRMGTFQSLLMTRAGGERFISWNSSVLEDASGRPWGILLIGLDLTDQRVLEEHLFQAEKLSSIGQLVAGVAHELNNPLTSILGFAEHLQEQPALPDQAVRPLQIICEEARRSAELVKRLLTFARQHKTERESCNLNAIVNTILDIQRYQFKKSGLVLLRELDPGLPPIHADPVQIQQVIVNLVSNALEALRDAEMADRPGIVTVRTRTSEEYVILEVEDNGPGIPEEHRRKLFDPFFTTKPPGKGTGLGLSISYGIVKEHGGNIHCRNLPGAGVRFVVELPRETSPFKEREESRTDDQALIVTDDTLLSDRVRDVLKEESITLHGVGSVSAALTYLKLNPVHLLIVDNKIQGGEGLRIYDRILASYPKFRNRTLFLANGLQEDRHKKVEPEEGVLLASPFQRVELKRALRELCGRFEDTRDEPQNTGD
ncbi:MAG: PAS domain S-box protein [Deltaproteobacteria bacterium]|nr:PAS domain S-box protein [Deltaproteobacteria bacterium]